MFKIALGKKEVLEKRQKPSSSPFSDFFRKASSAEKKRVFTEVAKEASKKQRVYMQ